MAAQDPDRSRSRWGLAVVALFLIAGAAIYLASRRPAPVRRTAPATSETPARAPAALVAAPRSLAEDEKSTIALFKTASPSVVHIMTLAVRSTFSGFNPQRIPRGSGSGFVWDDKGHVVTNFHVIQNADEAQVAMSDGSSSPARLVGAAPHSDIAVLRLTDPPKNLRPLPVGASHDLAVGQKVFAIGNPFGLDQTLTTGIISALGREIESVTRRPIKDVVQTDAAINPGNSGGPLLDSAGRLIGVNTAIYSPSGAYSGIGFAIPVDTVRWIVPQLIEHRRVVRPGLGVTLAPDQVAQELRVEGVLILDVQEGSAAEKAGLRPSRRDPRTGEVRLGDVIVAIDGKPVRSGRDLFAALEPFQVDDRVRITFSRDNRTQEVTVTLQELEETIGTGSSRSEGLASSRPPQ